MSAPNTCKSAVTTGRAASSNLPPRSPRSLPADPLHCYAPHCSQSTDHEAACMFAIFEDGSHQYRVKAGDRLEVDYRDSAQGGDSLSFERVLAAGNETAGTIGRPLIVCASVQAALLA